MVVVVVYILLLVDRHTAPHICEYRIIVEGTA